MKFRSFELSVNSPTNDYGPDFLVVEIGEAQLKQIRRLSQAVKELDIYAVHVFDRSPTWYCGSPELVCDELFELSVADRDGLLDRIRHVEEGLVEVRVEVPCLVVTDDEVYWVAESAGGDLFSSEPIMISRLEADFNEGVRPLARLVELIHGGTEFPDAVFRVSCEHQLSPAQVKALEADYDRMCVEA